MTQETPPAAEPQAPPHRSFTQVRPRHQPDAPAYCPQRDLAYIYGPAMREALRALDEAHWTPELRDYLNAQQITEGAIGQAAAKLGAAHLRFVNHEQVDSADDALRQEGWYNEPLAVRQLIYARLGEVLLGGFFVALRDVSKHGHEPDKHAELPELIAAGRVLLAHSIHGRHTDRDQGLRVSLELLRAERDQARAALSASQAQLRRLQGQAVQALQATRPKRTWRQWLVHRLSGKRR